MSACNIYLFRKHNANNLYIRSALNVATFGKQVREVAINAFGNYFLKFDDVTRSSPVASCTAALWKSASLYLLFRPVVLTYFKSSSNYRVFSL
jgi:hypothetical protein